jgi:hypothetical protein
LLGVREPESQAPEINLGLDHLGLGLEARCVPRATRRPGAPGAAPQNAIAAVLKFRTPYQTEKL